MSLYGPEQSSCVDLVCNPPQYCLSTPGEPHIPNQIDELCCAKWHSPKRYVDIKKGGAIFRHYFRREIITGVTSEPLLVEWNCNSNEYY